MVNPNLTDSEFPSRHLAGVGVAFYLMAALGRVLESKGVDGAARLPATYLDLVALGTVADVVTLDFNNRILVRQGLDRIRAGKAVAGIQALISQSGRSLQRTVSSDLGFVVGPRLLRHWFCVVFATSVSPRSIISCRIVSSLATASPLK